MPLFERFKNLSLYLKSIDKLFRGSIFNYFLLYTNQSNYKVIVQFLFVFAKL